MAFTNARQDVAEFVTCVMASVLENNLEFVTCVMASVHEDNLI